MPIRHDDGVASNHYSAIAFLERTLICRIVARVCAANSVYELTQSEHRQLVGWAANSKLTKTTPANTGFNSGSATTSFFAATITNRNLPVLTVLICAEYCAKNGH